MLEDLATDAELVIHELSSGPIRFTAKVVDNKGDFELALRDFSPDIILSDYSMPSFDGISAMHIAQEMCPDVP